ncbi:MAG: hypothetical protein QW570_08430, partial [Candidatus Caldarchaeum sp.]
KAVLIVLNGKEEDIRDITLVGADIYTDTQLFRNNPEAEEAYYAAKSITPDRGTKRGMVVWAAQAFADMVLCTPKDLVGYMSITDTAENIVPTAYRVVLAYRQEIRKRQEGNQTILTLKDLPGNAVRQHIVIALEDERFTLNDKLVRYAKLGRLSREVDQQIDVHEHRYLLDDAKSALEAAGNKLPITLREIIRRAYEKHGQEEDLVGHYIVSPLQRLRASSNAPGLGVVPHLRAEEIYRELSMKR